MNPLKPAPEKTSLRAKLEADLAAFRANGGAVVECEPDLTTIKAAYESGRVLRQDSFGHVQTMKAKRMDAAKRQTDADP